MLNLFKTRVVLFFAYILTAYLQACATSLTPTAFSPAPIPYNPTGSTITIAADYTTFFTHTNIAQCPLILCDWGEPGCAVTLAP